MYNKLQCVHECVRVSVHVINHMKGQTAVHGYCISTLLTSMALTRTEKQQIKEGGGKREWMRCRVKIVSVEARRLARAISQELLISGEALTFVRVARYLVGHVTVYR